MTLDQFRDSLDAIGDAGLLKLAGDIWPRANPVLAEIADEDRCARELAAGPCDQPRGEHDGYSTGPRAIPHRFVRREAVATEPHCADCGHPPHGFECTGSVDPDGKYWTPCVCTTVNDTGAPTLAESLSDESLDREAEAGERPPCAYEYGPGILCETPQEWHGESIKHSFTPKGGSRADAAVLPFREASAAFVAAIQPLFFAEKLDKLTAGEVRSIWDAALASEDEMIAALHRLGYRVLRKGELSELVGALAAIAKRCAPPYGDIPGPESMSVLLKAVGEQARDALVDWTDEPPERERIATDECAYAFPGYSCGVQRQSHGPDARLLAAHDFKEPRAYMRGRGDTVTSPRDTGSFNTPTGDPGPGVERDGPTREDVEGGGR